MISKRGSSGGNEPVVDVNVWTCLQGIMNSSSHPLHSQRLYCTLLSAAFVWFVEVELKQEEHLY